MKIMMRAALAALATLASAVPASSAPGDCRMIRGTETPDTATDDVSVCRQDVWFHQSELKVGNVDGARDRPSPSWNTTQPGSLAGGNGAAYAATTAANPINGGRSKPNATTTFVGTYTGALDNVAITLYGVHPGRPQLRPALEYRLIVDGEEVYGDRRVDLPKATYNQAVTKSTLALTNIHKRLVALGKAGDTTLHNITLTITSGYMTNDPFVALYDSKETPSGIVFNHDDLSEYEIIDIAPESDY